MVNAVEGCGQVEERQHREVARVQCRENIGELFKNRCLCRVIGSVCGLKGRKQVIVFEIGCRGRFGRGASLYRFRS